MSLTFCSCSKMNLIKNTLVEMTKGVVKKDTLIEEALFRLFNHFTGEELERGTKEEMERKTAIACFQKEIELDMLAQGYSRTYAVERFLYDAGYDKKFDGEIVVSTEEQHEKRIANVKQKLKGT